jgi:hypothetical protein
VGAGGGGVRWGGAGVSGWADDVQAIGAVVLDVWRDLGMPGMRGTADGVSGAPVPLVGDLLVLAGGPNYRVLGVETASGRNGYLLEGYAFWFDEHGPVLVPGRLMWWDGRVSPVEP